VARAVTSTPRHDGFRMPGEFEPHIGCWMLWPERSDNWRSEAKPAQRAFAAVATVIAEAEPVTVWVSRDRHQTRTRCPRAAGFGDATGRAVEIHKGSSAEA
jgi:agmatine deiminase